MSASISLEYCLNSATADELTLCIINNKICCMPFDDADVKCFTDTVNNHPVVNLNLEELYRPCIVNSQTLFTDSNESLPKRLVRTYKDQGLMEMLKTAADVQSSDSSIISTPAFYLLKSITTLRNVQCMFQPHLKNIGPNYLHQISETRNWMNSPIRTISWHPMCSKLAIATIDDSVRVYTNNKQHCIPVLKGKLQKHISCISWRPYAAFELAVGVELGIVLWKLDSKCIVSKPTINNAVFLKQSNVTSLTWNASGTLLVSASMSEGSFRVWDCEREIFNSVKSSQTGVSLITWTPKTLYLCSVGTNSMFRVWNTLDWRPKQWLIQKGSVQTACWTPCGNHLLFATNEDTTVYVINMNVAIGPNNGLSPQLGPSFLIDTAKTACEDGTPFGGLVQCIKMSSDGSYIAMLFKETSFVCICKSNVTSTSVTVSPSFLIKGYPNEYPNCIDFQKDFLHGSLLTIAWSSARIQHVPIINENF